MPTLSARSGMTLIESLVALTVGSIILVGASAAMGQVRAVTDALVHRAPREQLGAEIIAIVEAIGRGLREPRVLGDTALQGEWRILVGVACNAPDSTVVLSPAGHDVRDAMTFEAEGPRVNDRLDLYLTSDSMREGGWESFPVTHVVSMTAAGCGEGSRYVAPQDGARSVVRLTYAGTSRGPGAGTPVEIYRAVRLVPYRDVSAGWMLGLRHCVGMVCGPVQPIAGPVRSPRDGGLSFRALPGVGSVAITVRLPGLDEVFLGRIPAAGSHR
ncbi:MAG: PulJ/GspJ family protein [Candidatus Nanopelagicales bacterium]